MDTRDYFRSAIAKAGEDVIGHHDLAAYESAADILGLKPTRYLGGGMDAVALQLENNQVLKLTHTPLEPGQGARSFDLPVLRHGKVTVNAGTNYAQDVFFHVQPLASPIDSAAKAQVEQEFHRTVAQAGHEWIDPGAHQLGMFEGRPALVDYPSVVEGGLGSPGPLRPMPAAESISGPVPEGAPLTKTRWERDRELADAVRGRPDVERIRSGIVSEAAKAEQTGSLMVPTTYRGRLVTALTHEALQEKGFEVINEPRNLGGMMLQYPVKKLEGAAPAVPIPESMTTMEKAAKVAAKETLSEVHVNLESNVGNFLKRVMKLPFKKHSQLDPLAAAMQASELAGPTFQTQSYAGILAAGTLAIGAAFVFKGWKAVNNAFDDQQQPSWNYTVPASHQSPIHGGEERFSIQRTYNQSPDGTTKITVDDAALDHAAVEQAFTNKLRYGLAYGRRH